MRYIFIVLFLMGCKTPTADNKAMGNLAANAALDIWMHSEDIGTLGPVDCEGGGTELKLALKAAGSVPQPSQTPFPSWNRVVSVDDSKDFSIRLDVCYNESSGEASLQRIIQRTTYDYYAIMSVKSDAVVNGLAEAVLGDASTLKIINRYERWDDADVDNRITIQGFSVGSEQLVGVIHETKQEAKGGDSYVPFVAENQSYSPPGVVVGKLEPYDPFASELSCDMGPLSNVFVEVEKARIELSVCTSMGNSWSGNYVRVNVIDNNPSLPDSVRGKKVRVTEVAKYPFHHNICDSLKLSTPNADYLFTAGPGNAPNDMQIVRCDSDEVLVRNPKPEDKPWTMVYKIIYKNSGVTLQGRSDLMHWGKKNRNFFVP
ncbi:MAG: hypothetical protein AB7T49_14405 [Oligoflexales bacterium]